jgi:hypothetical protein
MFGELECYLGMLVDPKHDPVPIEISKLKFVLWSSAILLEYLLLFVLI